MIEEITARVMRVAKSSQTPKPKQQSEKVDLIGTENTTSNENAVADLETVNTIDTLESLHEKIVNCLKTIYDPEIPVNIFDLGLIYQIDIMLETKQITIQMTLTSPACPVAQTFPQTVQDAVLKVPNVSQVNVELTWDPPWTPERMSEVAKLQLNMY